jgi:hypothetical protein
MKTKIYTVQDVIQDVDNFRKNIAFQHDCAGRFFEEQKRWRVKLQQTLWPHIILLCWFKERSARRRAMEHVRLRFLLLVTMEKALNVLYGDRRGLSVDKDGDLMGII